MDTIVSSAVIKQSIKKLNLNIWLEPFDFTFD
jgi:hypothetical protein